MSVRGMHERFWLVVLICAVFGHLMGGASAASEGVRTWTGHEALDILEHIAAGYEANQPRTGQLHLRGRLYWEQHAEEGRQIPPGKLMEGKWVDFDYYESGGKRRYEETLRLSEGARRYVLDNNEKIVTFSGHSFKVYPLEKEEATWAMKTSILGGSRRMVGADEFGDVAKAMRTLGSHIVGDLAEVVPDDRVRVTESDGLYTVRYETGTYSLESTIDGRKGFNLVAVTSVSTHPKIEVRYTTKCEYAEDSTGEWVLASVLTTGAEWGVAFTKKLEVAQMRAGDLGLSDEIFEMESLDMPEGVYGDDHRFSPPLSLKKSGMPDMSFSEILTDIDIDITQVAEIDESGEVDVSDHEAFIEHQKALADAPVDAPAQPDEGDQTRWLLVLIIALLVIGLCAVCILRRRSKGGQQQ